MTELPELESLSEIAIRTRISVCVVTYLKSVYGKFTSTKLCLSVYHSYLQYILSLTEWPEQEYLDK